MLAPFGRFVEIGKRDVYEDAQIGLLAFRNNLSYFVLELDRLVAERPQLVGEIFDAVVRGFARRELHGPAARGLRARRAWRRRCA